MACDNRAKVYLGYEDEYVTDKHRSSLSYTTNKIGGYPVSGCSSSSVRGYVFRAGISLLRVIPGRGGEDDSSPDD